MLTIFFIATHLCKPSLFLIECWCGRLERAVCKDGLEILHIVPDLIREGDEGEVAGGKLHLPLVHVMKLFRSQNGLEKKVLVVAARKG